MEQIDNSPNLPNREQFEFPRYRNYETTDYSGEKFYEVINEDFQIFTIDNYKGLKYKGETVLDAEYDDILGFNYHNKFGHEWNDIETIEESKRRLPHCVFIKKNGLYGLFSFWHGRKRTIKPLYESICYSGNDYIFIAKQDNLFLLLTDMGEKLLGDNLYEEIVREPYIYSPFYHIRHLGKEGIYYNEDFPLITNGHFVPPIYNVIEWAFPNHFLTDTVLKKYDGNVIFDLSDKYSYVTCGYVEFEYSCNIVFVFKDDSNYIFIDEEGNRVYISEQCDEYIELEYRSKTLVFDLDEEILFEKDRDKNEIEDEESLCEDYEDEPDYEEDTYYALGGDDYSRFKENGGSIDDLMDELGY